MGTNSTGCTEWERDYDPVTEQPRAMIELLAQIHCPPPKPFTAGLVLWDDVVVEAAPIIGFMKKGKWSRTRVRAHCRDKGWEIAVVHELQR